MKTARSRWPIRPAALALLAAAVLVAHLALLRVRPPVLRPPGSILTQVFVTRAVPAAPALAPTEPRPAAPAAPAPPPAPATVAAAPPPAPAPAAAPAAVAAAPPASAAAPTPAASQAAATPEPVEPSTLAQSLTLPPPEGAQPRTIAIPDPVRMRYEVTVQARGLTVGGTASLSWRHDGQRYEAELQVGGALIPQRVQRSSGRITEQGLAPLRFSDQNRGETATHFERDKGKLTFSNNRPDAPLVEGMQDRLSVVVQLSGLIAAEPLKYPPGTSIAIPTAGTREAETWVFTVDGEEDIDLPVGRMRALKLTRQPRKEFDQRVELWLAPRVDYAPVRLRLTNPNGDSVDQRWSGTDRL